MQGTLFSAYFLSEGLALQPDWAGDAAALAQARATLTPLVDDILARARPSEANTERDLIDPVLRLLGWSFSVQEKASEVGRSDVPDYLLFTDEAAKAAAAREPAPAARYAKGAAIVEAKAWDLALDGAEPGSAGAPSTQMLRYLGTVGVGSRDRIRFGVLTNGRVWRLYDNKARSRLEGFVEIDLSEAAGRVVPIEGARPDHADHVLATFLFLFSAAGFRPDAAGRTAIERAVAASRDFEARVTSALADTVFKTVFPDLAGALAQHDPQAGGGPAYFAELREAALTWLYRLLFTLYAEDRDLLPTRTRRDGLRAMRESVAAALDAKETLSARRTNHDDDLRALWRQIDEGDAAIGLPPYNGGLFRQGRSPLLDRTRIPDAAFAPLLDALSREATGGARRLINYRDLNVQHLGSVYERLLEFDLVEAGGRVVTRPQTFARKTSGSYYTPEELVLLVIRRTVGPLLEDRRTAFAAAVNDRQRRDQDPAYRLPWLQTHDPASAFLTLRICDPAMGSGHFLVSLVDYLADEVMLATREAAELVEGYRSPLLDRLAAIRARILEQAREHRWTVDERQLIDRQLVRRIILKRVIHGVDKNPMAVELAKLSLWLHTFTVGAPLSFLDHHLRCGDSLFGEWVRPALDRLARGGLFRNQAVASAEAAVAVMDTIEQATDADLTEVYRSAEAFEEVREKTAPARAIFDLLQGFRWLQDSGEAALKEAKRLEKAEWRTSGGEAVELRRRADALRRRGRALDLLLEGEFGPVEQALDMCYGRIGSCAPLPAREGLGVAAERSEAPALNISVAARAGALAPTPDPSLQAGRGADAPDPAQDQLRRAAEIAQVSNFLHWEIAFPNVWTDWQSARPGGGFDAVIGNPPWDRLKMQEVEWFAARAPAIAHATRAADRKRMVRELAEAGDDLAGQYAQASEMAALAARMANAKPDKGGQYPLLGGGDVNLYSLFVERAARIVRPGGLVGLLTPSGIAGDLGASAFFRSISTSGRLCALLDYANRPAPGAPEFFPDVDSRFKFCALVFGGAERRFDAAECGFFLATTADESLTATTFPLAPADFAAVNPNTGTAPVFRTRRDAELTTAIYRRLPVLVRHREPLGGRGLDSDAAVGELALGGGAASTDEKPWPVRYATMFHMTNDSALFRTAAELTADGWYPVAGGRWQKGKKEAVPLYEGKMVQAFDHRAASVVVNAKNLHRPGQPEAATEAQHRDPDWTPAPQFYVEEASIPAGIDPGWTIGFKDVTAPTNVRTLIAAAVPTAGYGNTLPIVGLSNPLDRALLLANYNALALDFVARQKVQGQHLNWYILEQLPVIPPASYDRTFGAMTALEIVRREVLHLTYTAHDMAPFARDLGHVDADGAVLPPFRWDDADRRQRRARLDALYFHLYGLGRDDADYILSTFPIVRRQDEAAFAGRFVTRDLILAHMAALDAGDPDAAIALR